MKRNPAGVAPRRVYHRTTITKESTLPTNTMQAIAAQFVGRGVAVCRIKPGEKTPISNEWAKQSANPDDFNGTESIGILTGWLSDCNRLNHSLVCVDLDSPEALNLADVHLPETGMIDGRHGKPRSHRFYLVPNDTILPDCIATGNDGANAASQAGKHSGPKISHYKKAGNDKGKAAILDLLGTGAQAVAPPSMHPSGELREWFGGEMGEPAVVDYPQLIAAVESLAKACGWERPVTKPAKPAAPRLKQKLNPGEPTPIAATDAPPDAPPDTTGTLTIGGVEYTFAERVGRLQAYSDAIPDSDLSRSGNRGHDAIYRVLRIAYNDFAVQCPNELRRFADRYNNRLPANDQWSDADLAHKIGDAMRAPPAPDYPLGCKLAELERFWADCSSSAAGFVS